MSIDDNAVFTLKQQVPLLIKDLSPGRRSNETGQQARISHLMVRNSDKGLDRRRKARMILNTVCYSGTPITILTGRRLYKLAAR